MGLSRRGFVTTAGAGIAGVALGGCSGAATQAPPAPSSVPSASSAPLSSAAVKPMDFGALAGELSGKVIRSGQSGYSTAKRGYNPLFDGHSPSAVAQCASPQDVQACVRAAAASHTPITARSGGHSYAGYSNADGSLVVDVGRMAGVRVSADGTAVIGAGARLGSVYSALAAAGRGIAAGSCSTVGIAGLTLGGGVGVLTPRYGLTCDQLASLRIVTADGQLRTVSAGSEPDLFWALRGGGGGNLGIVTDFTFTTFAAPSLSTISVSFPAGSATPVFDAWQRWLPSTPPELWTKCSITSSSEPTVRLSGCYVGDTTTARKLINDFVGRTGVNGTVRVSAKSYGSAMEYFAGSPAREAFRASSGILGRAIDARQLTAIASAHSGIDIMFDALGGAVRKGDSAFPYRNALATVQIYGKTTSNSGSIADAVGQVRDKLGTLTGGGGYVNYLDPDMPNWGASYFGGNVNRLRDIAHRYDPNNVFGFAQGLARL